MSKKAHEKASSGSTPEILKQVYKDSLHKLQIELVKLQRHFIRCDDKILIIFEGRDAAGKDGTIKRIVQHLSPRENWANPYLTKKQTFGCERNTGYRGQCGEG